MRLSEPELKTWHVTPRESTVCSLASSSGVVVGVQSRTVAAKCCVGLSRIYDHSKDSDTVNCKGHTRDHLPHTQRMSLQAKRNDVRIHCFRRYLFNASFHGRSTS